MSKSLYGFGSAPIKAEGESVQIDGADVECEHKEATGTWMEDEYTKERGSFSSNIDLPEPYEIIDGETPFHIGQSYEKKPLRKVVCRSCGGDRFVVGSGSYATGIQCPTCEWETIIHSG